MAVLDQEFRRIDHKEFWLFRSDSSAIAMSLVSAISDRPYHLIPWPGGIERRRLRLGQLCPGGPDFGVYVFTG
jgi:hypothetical protein